MLESAGNSQNTASAAWDTFTTLLEYKCKREGTHFVEGEPASTIKECASCGVESDKPLWVREHSYPVCGFEMDRDANANAAINILSLAVSRSEDWDGPKPQRRPRDEVSRDHESLRFSNDLWRLHFLCSPHRVVPRLWMQSAS